MFRALAFHGSAAIVAVVLVFIVTMRPAQEVKAKLAINLPPPPVAKQPQVMGPPAPPEETRVPEAVAQRDEPTPEPARVTEPRVAERPRPEPITPLVRLPDRLDPIGPPLPLPAPPAVDDGVLVSGRVFSRLTNRQARSHPFTSGVVVAVPMELMPTIETGISNPFSQALFARGRFAMPWTLYNDHRVYSGELADGGHYTMTVPAGEYAFCLGNLDGRDAPNPQVNAVWVDCWIPVTVTGRRQVVNPVFDLAGNAITLAEDP